ncbi:sigma-70 family RNA polymerase sigma factor [Cytobacillus sp. FSL K6-0129]|uniref:sigma-70 family RNA polymerase sigma factor n=1 Tax=Cytobacillus sp. FSL K6-0129 TaxID=2921421 RepID=UPI0030F9D760
MRVLIAEYKRSLRLARTMRRKIKHVDHKSLKNEEDEKVLSSIISDLVFTIEWLRRGHNPDARRGIDKNGVYITDPSVLDVLPINQQGPSEKDFTQYEKEIVEDALCTLSDREKEIFLLIKVEGITFDYASELLGIKKSTVQTHLKRAEMKIEQRKNESLFLRALCE